MSIWSDIGSWFGGSTDSTAEFTPLYGVNPQTGQRESIEELQAKGFWSTGSYAQHPTLNRIAGDDPSRSVGERIAEKRNNFYFGGDPNYARQQADAARGAGQQYGYQFGSAASDARANSSAAMGRGYEFALMDPRQFDAQMTGSGETAKMQGDAFNALMDFANQGPGPSGAQALYQQNASDAMASNLAMARSGRGTGASAAALRMAQSQNAGMAQQAANQSAMLRAQEDAAWRQQQAAAYGAAGGIAGDIRQGYLSGAGLQLGQQQYGTNAILGAQGLNDQTALGWAGMQNDALRGGAQAELGFGGLGFQYDQAGTAANQAYESNLTDIYGIHQGVQQGRDALAAQQAMQREAAALQAGGAILTSGASALASSGDEKSSDIRAKKNIQPAADKAEAFARYMAQARGDEAFPHLVRENPFPDRTLGGTLLEEDPRVQGRSGERLVLGADGDAFAELARQAPPSTYEYRDPNAPGAAAGPQFGPMANDLARSPIGRTAVVEDPKTGRLGVDTGRLALVNTGVAGAQQTKIDSLEAQLAELQQLIDGGAAEPVVGSGLEREALDRAHRRSMEAPAY